MKKYLIILLLFITVPLYSQTYKFRTIYFSMNVMNNGIWSGWSTPSSSNLLITIDLDSEIIKVYSNQIQLYKIIDIDNQYYDSDGDYHFVLRTVDQEYDRGTVRMLKRVNGKVELYIEFADIRWAYGIIPI